MQLTQEQLDAVRRGESVRVQEMGTDVVLLRADVFDQIQSERYDAEGWTDLEMDLLAAEDADRLGWEGMEVYQDDDR